MKKIILIAVMLTDVCFAAVKVVDGDSLEINGERIRIDGIDAPEFFQICEDAQQQEYQCGQKSWQYLQQKINNQEVDCRCEAQKDRFGRKICECFIDGKSLNRTMVKAGWARTYRDDKYAAEEEYAAKHKLGIWQGKHMRPAIYRALNRCR